MDQTEIDPTIISEINNETNVDELQDSTTQLRDTADKNGLQVAEDHIPTTGSTQMDIVKSAFDVLTADTTEGNAGVDLVRMFYAENPEIKEEFSEKYSDLLPLITKDWSMCFTRLMITICENIRDQVDQTKKVLVDLCLLHLHQVSKQNIECQGARKFASRAKEVFEMGKEFASNKNYIHAVISFYTAAKLHNMSNKGDESVFGVYICSFQTYLVSKEITKQESLNGLVTDHVIILMREMTDFIRSMENSTHQVRIKYEAWCFYVIGLCYIFCAEHELCANEYESAIELLEKEFKENAKNYKIYAHCLNNAGGAYGRMENSAKEVVLLNRALKGFMSAKDWKNMEEKDTEVKRVKRELDKS